MFECNRCTLLVVSDVNSMRIALIEDILLYKETYLYITSKIIYHLISVLIDEHGALLLSKT